MIMIPIITMKITITVVAMILIIITLNFLNQNNLKSKGYM